MLTTKININEKFKIKASTTQIRRDFYLKKYDSVKQFIYPKKSGLNVYLPEETSIGSGFVIYNMSDTLFFTIKTTTGGTINIVDNNETGYFQYNGDGVWVETSDFLGYIQIPITLTQNNDISLGQDDYILNTIGKQEIIDKTPSLDNFEKIKFKPIYNDIKFCLFFAKYDTFGNYLYHTNDLTDGLDFVVDSKYFNTSYLQLNYYTDNVIQGNSLIDYKQYKFDKRHLIYGGLSDKSYTTMITQKPFKTIENINIENYYFYYFEDLFTSDTVTLYFNGEFKNTKTGKSQLFTTNNDGVITKPNKVIDADKLYSKMVLYKNERKYTYDEININSTQICLYEVISY